VKKEITVALITAAAAVVAAGIPAVATIVTANRERDGAVDAALALADSLLSLLALCLQDNHDGHGNTVEALTEHTRVGLDAISRVEKYLPEDVRKSLEPIRDNLSKQLKTLDGVPHSAAVGTDPQAKAAAEGIKKSTLKARDLFRVVGHH